MEAIGMITMLLVCSISDLWKRKISLVVLLVFTLTGIGYQIGYGQLSLIHMIAGASVGVVLYGISVATREKIGKGDALMMVSTGIYLGFWKNIVLLWLGSVMAGITSLVILACKRKGKNETIPFAPFLLMAYLFIWLWGEG